MTSKIKRKFKNIVGWDFFELVKHGKNYVSADLFTKGLAFISIPIFTRLLVPTDYGIISIFTSFVAIFSIIYGLGLRGAVGRYYYEKTDDFDAYYGSNLLLVLFWGAFLSIILYFGRDYLYDFFKIPPNVIFIGIGVVFFSTTFELYNSYLQASKQSKKFSRIAIFRGLALLLIAVIITVQLKEQRFYGKVTAQLIVWIILFIYSTISILKISKITFKLKYIKYSLLFSIPIVFHLLSQYVLSSFDQVIINQLVGTKETGLYSFAYQVGMIQNIISMGILRAWSPIFYDKMNKKDFVGIQNLAKKYSMLVYSIAFSLILFSRELVIILADKKYYASLEIVPIVIVAYVFFFLYTMYVNYSFYYKKTKLIALFTIIAGSINIGLNYLLIPKYGYMVAAWTTLASYGVLFVLHFINSKYIIKAEKVTNLKVLLPNFGLLICFVIGYSLGFNVIDNYFLLLGFKLISLIFFLVVMFRKKIFLRG